MAWRTVLARYTRTASLLVSVLALILLAVFQAAAEAPANEHFQRTWARTDRPVADLTVSRTWMWGPEAFTAAMTEPYAESPGGQRTVQYYDKSRMEVTHPDTGDPASIWYVTNGLLVVELVTGRMQLGDDTFEQHEPAIINVAGDADDPTGPTYASFLDHRDRVMARTGDPVVERIDRAGNVTRDDSLADRDISLTSFDEVIGHNIAGPFWDFMISSGTVWVDGQSIESRLFQNPYYATGRPITEPYWANVKVAGTYQDVLMQCFERRCLTYTPGNEPGWRVEAGNVGQHYHTWRYEQACAERDECIPNGGDATPTATTTAPSDGPTATPPPTIEPTTTAEPTETPTPTATPTPEPPEYHFLTKWGEAHGRNTGLDSPRGVAGDADGNIYVADSLNHRIQKYTENGEFLLQWGEQGSGQGQFDEPDGIAVDSAGNVYVADVNNNRIQKFDSQGNFAWSVDGTASAGGVFSLPHGVAVNSRDEVYVADTSNERVVWFDNDGNYLGEWYGDESEAGPFVIPFDITVDIQDDVYVLDTGNSRVVKYGPGGAYLMQWGEVGSGPGQLRLPQGIAAHPILGNVFVADTGNGRVQSFANDGRFVGEWNGSGADAGRLSQPAGIAIGGPGTGAVYVADTNHDRIDRYSIYGERDLGWYDDLRGRFKDPEYPAIDPEGNVLVAEWDHGTTTEPALHRVQKFGPRGEFQESWSVGVAPDEDRPSGARLIGGITVDSEGFFYVSVPNRDWIFKYAPNGQYVTHWGMSGNGEGRMEVPLDLAVDADDNIYVIDSDNFRVQKYTSGGSYLGQWGTEGSEPGEFADPRGITIHGDNVYVADAALHRVKQFNLNGTFIRQWGSLGSASGEFRGPQGIATDLEGNVFVSDTGNDRIQMFTPEGSYLTQWGREGDENGQFRSLDGIAVNADAEVYVADRLNRRIQVFTPKPVGIGPAP